MTGTEMNVRRYLPNLIKLGGPRVLNWDECEKRFMDLWETRSLEGKEGEKIEATVYDILLQANNEMPKAIRFLNFFNLIIDSLNDILDPEGKKKIVKTIHHIFSAPDYRFLNFLGELMVLNILLRSKIFLLGSVEVKAANNKTIDFELINLNQDGRRDLLEVHNVHLDDEKVENDDGQLFKFFATRRFQKIEQKTKDMPTPALNIQYMQVYWGSFESMLIFASFFKRYQIILRDVEPLAFATKYVDSDPLNCVHSYGRIHQVFAEHLD